MAQIEVGKDKAKSDIPTITGHIEFADLYTGKTVSMPINMRKHVFKSGKTGYMLFSGKVPTDPDTGYSFRLFNGMIGVYDKTKEYTPLETTTSDAESTKKSESDTPEKE